jgi:hypothetical protein
MPPGEAATIVILPVVHIKREAKKASAPRTPRRRKRPASRS